jgi:hypothetical protein
MSDLLKRVTAERLSGDRPAAPRALGAVFTYKLCDVSARALEEGADDAK